MSDYVSYQQSKELIIFSRAISPHISLAPIVVVLRSDHPLTNVERPEDSQKFGCCVFPCVQHSYARHPFRLFTFINRMVSVRILIKVSF